MKVQQLSGAALDWAVAKVVCPDDLQYFPMAGRWGIDCVEEGPGFIVVENVPRYSTEWAHGGPLVDRYKVGVVPLNVGLARTADDKWFATAFLNGNTSDNCCRGDGATALEATCRAVVGLVLGDEIEVPDDLA